MMADWDSSAFSAYENLEMATSFDLGMAFQENIPDMFHESSVVPDVPSEFYPPVQETYDLMSATCTSGIKPELCDISNAHFVRQQQHTEYIPDWEAFQVPSTTTSPVQFESWQHAGATVNTVPAGYQQQQQLYNTNVVNGRKRRAVPQPCEASQMDFNVDQFPGMADPVTKPKRKRVQNTRQRKAANVRERKRMFHLNEAFDSLKTRVPTFSYEKRLSRIETLKLAMTYISFMSQLLDGKKPNEIPLNSGSTTSFSLEDLENLQRTIGSSYVSDGTESSESGSTSS